MRARAWPCLLLAALGCALAGCPQLLVDDFRSGATLSSGGSAGQAGRGAGGLDGGPPGGGASGAPDAAAGALAALQAALAHRYGFDGLGGDVVDSLGGASGFLHGTLLTGAGFVRLAGSDEYVSLPNGLLSSGNDKTIEVWLTWRGGAAWQRVFDFGVSTGGELEQGYGVSYLFLTAASPGGVMAVGHSLSGYAGEVRLDGTAPLPTGALTHVAVTVDGAGNRTSLYVNGSLHVAGPLVQRLSEVVDLNVWIGRSQYVSDPSLDADVTEVRIYDAALDAEQVALSHRLGPDAPPIGNR